jgi:phage baseplate assembly protein W
MIIKIPFTISDSGKVENITESSKVISQKIGDYLLTNEFERPMQTTYGANSNYLVYENFDSMVFEEYKVETLQGLRKHISGATIINISLSPQSMTTGKGYSDDTMLINVQYKLPTGGVRTAQYNLVSPTTLTEDTLI